MDYTKCDSASDFEAKFRTILTKLDVVEGEETWLQLDTALKNLISLVKAGAPKFESFVPTMKQATKFINSSILSERTRLSGTGLMLIEELARQMETRFQPLCDILFPSALKTCGRANKVFVTRGVSCLTTVITYAHCAEQTPNICYAAANDPNKTVRSSSAKLLMSIVSCCTVPEITPHLATVEKAIAEGVVDANPDARTTARQSYEIYVKRFSNRVEQFHSGLSSTAKKYLKIEDSGSANGQPRSQFAAFRQQRQPLRDRISAQRANMKKTAGAPAAASDDSAGANLPKSGDGAPILHKPKPVRPIARPGPTAVRRNGTSAAAVPLTLSGPAVNKGPVPDKAASSAPPSVPVVSEPPSMGAKFNSLENVLMSPRSTKPTLVRLFDEDKNDAQTSAVTDKSPHDSARASVSPTESRSDTRAPSPTEKTAEPVNPAGEDKTGVSSKTATPAASGDESSSSAAPKSKGVPDADLATAFVESGTKKTAARASSARAKRGHGLSFSSLNNVGRGANSTRAPHAVRPQSRNLVSSRMEEALRSRSQANSKTTATRAQRTAKTGAAAAPPKRMTLRSDTQESGQRGRPAASSGDAKVGPGYLRATQSSSKRLTATTGATRGTKRRKREDSVEDETPQASAKAVKVGARRRSATKQ
ncbi:hypothetical protein H4R24_005585 [Coemansia sp. RSA 988]|nr:hypothetical protein H4R24_005585 [Coemansia sp. RSA 988]